MGQERECRARVGKRAVVGKAYLETDHLLFRGGERVKVPLKELTAVKASGGVLRLEYVGGPLELELGAAAEKWAEKILHPPSRADKLGVKPGSAVRLVGEFQAGFEEELRMRSTTAAAGRAKADLVFYAAGKAADLTRIGRLAGGLKPNGALWVVYPKGAAEIRETEVLMAGRDAGLTDTKVASFSATHTALRFVIPAARR